MPVELPGFYFDEERNRYFPLATKPKPSRTDPVASQGSQTRDTADIVASEASSSTSASLKRKRGSSRWNLTQFSRSTCNESQRTRAMHQILGCNYSNSSTVLQSFLPTPGVIKSFGGTVHDGEFHPFVGDSRGWLWTPGVLPPGRSIWTQELSIAYETEVNTISISGSKVAATSFGPSPRVAIRDLEQYGRTTLLALKGIHEVWSSHLYNNSLVMGANRCLVSIHDIELSSSIRRLGTDSDTLSVTQQEHLVYAGCRNGTILRFDMRIQEDRKMPLYSAIYKHGIRAPTSVVHIDTIGEHQMLVSMLNDELISLDLRYIKDDQPVVQFEGHRNAYTHKLGITMDPMQQYLFAAGDDNRIRGWSLSTGRPLTPPSSTGPFSFPSNPQVSTYSEGPSPQTLVFYNHPPQESNFLTKIFPDTIPCMQVIDHTDCRPNTSDASGSWMAWNPGVMLWAGCEKSLYQFPLGQRSGPRLSA